MNDSKAFPAWARVGCGCLGALGAIAIFAVAIGFWGVQKARRFGEEKEGLMALLLIDCGGDSRHRFGVWLGPDPDPEAEAADLDLSGTVSDPEAIERFLSPIHPCR